MSATLIDCLTLSIILYAAFMRLRELKTSRLNQKALEAKGFSRKDSRFSYYNMLVLHSSFFVSLICEWQYLSLLSNELLQLAAMVTFLFAQYVRFSALNSLGKFWNTNIMSSSSNSTFVQAGPYRYIRHPNYLAVILEFLSIPLVAGAWRSALIYSIWNFFVLKTRIMEEEAELFKIPDYEKVMGPKKRLIPGIF